VGPYLLELYHRAAEASKDWPLVFDAECGKMSIVGKLLGTRQGAGVDSPGFTAGRSQKSEEPAGTMTATARVKSRRRPTYETSPFVYRIMKCIFSGLMRTVFRYRASGQESFPSSGPVIVAVNHLHFVDPPAVMLAVPRKTVTLAANKWRRSPIVRSILRLAGVVFVRRGEVDRQALRGCLDVLAKGGVLGVAPEGTRSKTGALQRAKPGVAYLAFRSKAPIVPVAFWGTERLRDWVRLKRPTCRAVVGRPFRLPEFSEKPTTEELQHFADLIMIRVGLLLPASYRGVYAERCAAVERGESTELSVLLQDA